MTERKIIMKKTFRNILTLTSAMLVMATASMNVSAAYNNKDTGYTDTDSFTFTKHYVLDGDTTNGKSPKEEFTVTATRYSFANVPERANLTVENMNSSTSKMPAIDDIILEADKGAAGKVDTTNVTVNVTADVILPEYEYVGDYWYELKETAGNTAGVTYDDKSYYLHVQVLNNGDLSGLIRLVTLHDSAPNTDGTPSNGNKNDGITNTYSNGSLSVTKQVKGNMGDKDQTYTATVEFESALPVKSEITYDDGTEITYADETKGTTQTLKFSDSKNENGNYTATATLALSKDEIVTFTNIPYGVTYTVTENDYSADGYTHSFTFDSNATTESSDTVTAEGGTWSNAKATGLISDASDTVTIINEKNVTVDVGVILDNAQYFALFGIAAAGLAGVFIIRRKKESHE